MTAATVAADAPEEVASVAQASSAASSSSSNVALRAPLIAVAISGGAERRKILFRISPVVASPRRR